MSRKKAVSEKRKQLGLSLEDLQHVKAGKEEAIFKRQRTDFPGRPVLKSLPSNAWGTGSIPGWEVKIPHALWPKNQNVKQKQYCNKFNKDFKKWST